MGSSADPKGDLEVLNNGSILIRLRLPLRSPFRSTAGSTGPGMADEEAVPGRLRQTPVSGRVGFRVFKAGPSDILVVLTDSRFGGRLL